MKNNQNIKISRILEINLQQQEQLARILFDSVVNGASVGFLMPFTLADADNYWLKINRQLNDDHQLWVVIVDNVIVATAQLIISDSINGRHRAEIAKLLVLPEYHGQGIASKIMSALEKAARDCGISLLILDTQTGSDAEKIYLHLEWHKVGEIPEYALNPAGTAYSTSYFYKLI